jgi:hypothetical protein
VATEMQPSRSASTVEAMAGAGDRCAAAATALPITPLGVVVTTALEERMWRRDAPAGEVLTVVTGADPERARQGVERLIGNGVGGLLSFGLAAALAPAVAPGDVVVADCGGPAVGRRDSLRPGLAAGADHASQERRHPGDAGPDRGSSRSTAPAARARPAVQGHVRSGARYRQPSRSASGSCRRPAAPRRPRGSGCGPLRRSGGRRHRVHRRIGGAGP